MVIAFVLSRLLARLNNVVLSLWCAIGTVVAILYRLLLSIAVDLGLSTSLWLKLLRPATLCR